MKNVNKSKIYALVKNNLFRLIAFILFGILAGYLFDRYSVDKENSYMVISIIFFFVVGIIDLIVQVIKGLKK